MNPHIQDPGKHHLEVDEESTYDLVRRKRAGTFFAPNVPSTSWQGVDSSSPARAFPRRPLGWALKVAKRPTRMTDNLKTFLMNKFEVGVRTGNNANLVQVAREMKILRNESGKLMFEPGEWRTAQQISGLFSRQTSLQHHKGIRHLKIP